MQSNLSPAIPAPEGAADIAAYGAQEQARMNAWLDIAVDTVAKDAGDEAGQALARLLAQLTVWDALCRPRRLLGLGGAGLPRLRGACRRLLPLVEDLAGALFDRGMALRRMVKVFARMRDENSAHQARLDAYLSDGRTHLDALRGRGDDEAAARLEKRLHDLALSRQVSLQTQAQLDLLTRGNEDLIAALDQALGHTLPLWKTQVTLALGLAGQAQAAQDIALAQRAALRGMAGRQSLLSRLAGLAHSAWARVDRQALRSQNAALLQGLQGADSAQAKIQALRGQFTQQQRK
ncbi:MAG: toxic anion resistance protein [Oscillospiraceae bacterium]|jgi:hypothetical protein|nr:toxic anion resistance protein [Oscillospiraceae bacterium]